MKRVDELGFYNLGHNDLAKKVGLTTNKTTAAIRVPVEAPKRSSQQSHDDPILGSIEDPALWTDVQPLWLNGFSSYNGLNDRVPEEEALKAVAAGEEGRGVQ